MNAGRAASDGTMRTKGLLVAALALVAPGGVDAGDGAAPPDAACVERAIDAFERRYEAVRDLTARFRQTTRSVALGGAPPSLAATATGTVIFAKPGRMRWSYEQPEPSLVVSDGVTLWIYDPERREAQRLAVGSGEYLSGAAIQFLLGEGDVRREFRVTAQSCAAGDARLELLPRRAASYEKLRIRTDPRTGEILETAVVDLLGNVTEVAFDGIRANVDPRPEVFTFEPPDGVRVLEIAPATPAREDRP